MPGLVLSHGVQRSTDTVSGQKESPVPKDHGQTKPKTTIQRISPTRMVAQGTM